MSNRSRRKKKGGRGRDTLVQTRSINKNNKKVEISKVSKGTSATNNSSTDSSSEKTTFRSNGLRLRDKVNLLILALSAMGGLLSIYLWNITITAGTVDFCTTNCEAVLSSEFGKLLGVPVATLGFIYYFMLIALAFQRIQIKHRLLDQMMGLLIVFGVLFTLYLRYLEFVVIGDICMWCWVSVVIILTITVLFSYWVYKDKTIKQKPTVS